MISMKSIFVKINGITDATTLCKKASVVDGDIEIRKGRWCVDAKSIMGIFSMDLSKLVEFRVLETNQNIAEVEAAIAPYIARS